jgi:hypothetical protein
MSAISAPSSVFTPVVRSVVPRVLQVLGWICLLLGIDMLALAILQSHGINVPVTDRLPIFAGQIVGWFLAIGGYLFFARQAKRAKRPS